MGEEFLARLREAPDDVDALGVYADWLSDQGDPRGEFIRVQLSLEDERLAKDVRDGLQQREAELLKEHQTRWLGPLAEPLAENPVVRVFGYSRETNNFHFEFRRGFLRKLHIAQLNLELMDHLMEAEETQWIEDFAVESFLYEDPRRSNQLLAECRRFNHLCKLQIGEAAPDVGYTHSWCYFSQAADFIENQPHLEELHLYCKEYDIHKLLQLPLANLRVLRIYHLGVRDHTRRERDDYEYPLQLLAANPAMSNLTHLLIHPHHEEYHHDHYGEEPKASFLPIEQVEAVVNSAYLQRLTHLQLRMSNMGDDGCQLLVDSGILGQLQHLDLRHGCITDRGARILAATPEFASLEMFDVSRNALTDDGLAVLRETGVNVLSSGQMDAEEIEAESYLLEGDFE